MEAVHRYATDPKLPHGAYSPDRSYRAPKPTGTPVDDHVRTPRGFASPKLTPKHGRKSAKKRPRSREPPSPHLDFPPPPAYPPPELYNLSDEYSAEPTAEVLPVDNLLRFRAHVEAPDHERFWNSPVEAPWGCFGERVTDLDAHDDYPLYPDEIHDQLNEELMLINKLKEEGVRDAKEHGFRNEIWVGTNDRPATIQTTKNHISNVLITHGNDEVVEGFVENKPIAVNTNQPAQRLKLRSPPAPVPDLNDSPDEYSYAYYEPGPAKTIEQEGVRRHHRDRTARHTYTTRYGTEENIYEEITEVGESIRNRFKIMRKERIEKLKKAHLGSKATSQVSLQQTLVEEEVREVQSNHRRMLGQLNLAMEAMLMPGQDVPEELEPTPVTDLDSGFSGSSGNSASYVGSTSYVAPRGRAPVKSLTPARSPTCSPTALLEDERVDYRAAGRCHDVCCTAPQYQAPGSPISRDASYVSVHPNYSAGSLDRAQLSQNVAKSRSFPRTGEHNIRRSEGKGGFKASWAKRGWRRIAGLANSTNKVNAIDEPHGKTGWEPHHGRASSEDSWYSGSDNEMSSGDESSERSATSSTRSNGHLRQTLHKARTLCDKLRPHGNHAPHLQGALQPPEGAQPPGRLARWFSMRRGSSNQYEVDSAMDRGPGKMPLLPELEEETPSATAGLTATFTRRTAPPTLPTQPASLSPAQLKRRQIVAHIVHNENSYVATLQRLVNEYKKPLEDSSPAILSSNKISVLFRKLPEILQCHTLFRIALAEAVRTWDQNERIGDVFIASFSKSVVLDVYSEFINNFSVAMDLAKSEAKRKNALYEFLQMKQMTSPDRLNFFGLMVKPVQRFPQFILFLQDLLKHTPHGHQDRMSLQLALTQLESLAEMLNERKREAEQFQAFKEMLRRVSGKLAAKPSSGTNRCLLREDNVTQLEFNATGGVSKSKARRLLLLNDLLLCVSVAPREDSAAAERLSLKWTHPVTDVEVLDNSASPTLSRLLTPGLTRSGSLKKEGEAGGGGGGGTATANDICQEMAELMHDFNVISRITDLVGTLKGSYNELNVSQMKIIQQEIQLQIQQKDEAMSWVDSCCLQLTLKNKNGKEETLTFQTENPAVKKEWTTELRLAQLALDPSNSPAWEIPEQEQRPSTKMPLFVKSQCVYSSQHQTEVRCGCFYTAATPRQTGHRRQRAQNLLWVSTSDELHSHITVLQQTGHQASQLRSVLSFDLPNTRVTCMEHVRADPTTDHVWMGTDNARILIYAGGELERGEEVNQLTVAAGVLAIRYHGDQVFVALANGRVALFPQADMSSTTTVELGSDPVTCLLPINSALYAACDKKVFVLCPYTGEIQKNFTVQHGSVSMMAHSGVGLWISLRNSSTICLYHTETFKHLQDINIANNVLRVTSPPNGTCANHDCANNNRTMVTVTSLLACKGLLWVGTNVGICLTIPLPRLEGVPIISGRVNISYHAHFGPISFLLPLQPRLHVAPARSNSDIKSPPSERTVAEKIKHQLVVSPVPLRRKSKEKDLDPTKRMSKTLPRGHGGLGGSTTSSQGSGECDVYGLYGDLMNCREGSDDSNAYDPIRRSDPDLTTKLGTLDRRLRMRASRPRSLDLSSWSVASHASSLYTSSSEESVLKRTNSGSQPARPPKLRDLKRSESVGALPTATSSPKPKRDKTPATPKPKREVALERRATKKVGAPDRRTVITLMGGRGYVNWHQACCISDRARPIKEPNCADAHIAIWEMKL